MPGKINDDGLTQPGCCDSFIGSFLRAEANDDDSFFDEMSAIGGVKKISLLVDRWPVHAKHEKPAGDKKVVVRWGEWSSPVLSGPTWLEIAAEVNAMMSDHDHFPRPFLEGIEELEQVGDVHHYLLCLEG